MMRLPELIYDGMKDSDFFGMRVFKSNFNPNPQRHVHENHSHECDTMDDVILLE